MSRWLFRIAALYLLVGICFGMFMAASHNFTEAPLHAHLNLLGFVIPTVAALWYRSQPEAGRNRLALAHFVLHTAGLPVMCVALYYLLQGVAAAEPFVAGGSTAVALGMLCLIANVWRMTGAAWGEAPPETQAWTAPAASAR